MISINFFKRPFFSESKLTIFVFLISSIFLVSCGGNSSSSSGGGQEDTGERDLFKDDELLAVTVDMDASDWTDLSYEGRQVTEWAPNCGFPGYNYYYGSVSVNGEDVSNVAVRKKGTIGSLTIFRPSLKINFDKGDGNDGRTFYGNKRITLNNNHQDPSDIKQCLSYSVFDDAGLPTPQCGFSQVTAQQQDLGIYTYVEAIKKPFLRRVFANDDGNLYEGSSRYGEFNESHLPYFELKTNEEENDRSDLDAVLAAMSVADSELLLELDKVINLDQFITFSAVEALVGHENGYNGNQNNFYIYNNPDDNRFHFIPYGTDQAFSLVYHLSSDLAPASVFQGSELMQRLWSLPEFQTRYDTRMRELLETVWDEGKYKAEMDSMAALTNADPDEIAEISAFIDGRRSQIESELGTVRTWERELQSDVTDCPIPTPISGEFNLYWGDDSPIVEGGTFSIVIENADGSESTIAGGGSVKYKDRGDGIEANTMNMVGVDSVTGTSYLLVIAIPPQSWEVGDIYFHSIETVGRLLELQPPGLPPIDLGLIGDGGIVLESASEEQDGLVKGSFDAVYVNND